LVEYYQRRDQPFDQTHDQSRRHPIPCRVGMSVPAHPQAIELLVVRGYRGWLKPSSPED